jgi:hypothetical protein
MLHSFPIHPLRGLSKLDGDIWEETILRGDFAGRHLSPDPDVRGIAGERRYLVLWDRPHARRPLSLRAGRVAKRAERSAVFSWFWRKRHHRPVQKS